MENKHTAMQQLLAQLKDERAKLPMLIEWDRCYQAIEMVIQNTYRVNILFVINSSILSS